MIPTDAIVVRAYDKDTDEDFIYSTWIRNYKHSSYFAKRIKPSVFFKEHHIVIDHLMQKPEMVCLVAHPKNDQDTLLGYAVFEKLDDRHVVHFTYVKDAFRMMGIAKTIYKTAEIDMAKLSFSHWTMPVDELIKKYPDIIYNPYKL